MKDERERDVKEREEILSKDSNDDLKEIENCDFKEWWSSWSKNLTHLPSNFGYNNSASPRTFTLFPSLSLSDNLWKNVYQMTVH